MRGTLDHLSAYFLDLIGVVSGHFYFTQLLLPLLVASAKTSPDGKARVINTSSMGHAFVSGIDFDTLRDGPKRIKAGTTKLYSQSKFVSTYHNRTVHTRVSKNEPADRDRRRRGTWFSPRSCTGDMPIRASCPSPSTREIYRPTSNGMCPRSR